MRALIFAVVLGTAFTLRVAAQSCGTLFHGQNTQDPLDCRTYFQCTNGDLLKKTCPQGMFYEESKGLCIINTGQCVIGFNAGTSCGNLTNGAFSPDRSNCAEFFVCITGILRKLSCPDGQYFNPIKLQCVDDDGTCPQIKSKSIKPIESKFNCGSYPNGAKVVSAQDCTRYSICLNGVFAEQVCPSGLYFNPTYSACILNDGTCASRPTSGRHHEWVNLNCGHIPNGELEKDQFNCAKFFVCSQGNLMHLACPRSQYFSRSLMQCVDDDGTCQDVVPAEKQQRNEGVQSCACCGDYANGEKVKDPADCQSYLMCCNGQMMPQKCPSAEYFNENTRSCLPDNGACVPVTPKPTNCGIYEDGQHIQDGTNCVNYFVCSRGEIQKYSCPNGQYFNKIRLACTPDDGSCPDVVPNPPLITPPTTGNCGSYANGDCWADNNNCQGYNICCNGDIVQQLCPYGQYFNVDLKKCAPDNGQCKCSPEPSPCDCGNYTNGEFVPNNENCVWFFVCVNGRMQSKSCPDGWYFNATHRRCFLDDGSCSQVIPTLPPTNQCCGNLSNGQQGPVPDDCNKYVICCNGQLVNQTCAEGFYFSEIQNMCVKGDCKPRLCDGVFPDGTKKPIENDCENYLICRDGVFVSETCPDGEYFNNATLECEPGECTVPEKLCDGEFPDGTKKPIENDCENYLICRDGVFVSETCPDGEYFNNATLECEPGECTVPEKLCDGEFPDGTKKPIEDDCESYLICRDGEFVKEMCSSGTYFNSTSLECDGDNSECGGGTGGLLPCPEGSSEGSVTVNSTSCTSYLVCCNGYLININCPSGYYFNSETFVCAINNGECEGSGVTSPVSSTTQESTTTTSTTTTEKPTTTSTTTTEKPTTTSTTTTEKPTTTSTTTTQISTTTSTTTRQPSTTPAPCGDLNDSETGPNSKDCSSFLVCCDGRLITVNCPKNYYYNSTTKVCEIDDGQCVQKSCGETPNGGFVADEKDCRAYKLCINGIFIEGTCTEGDYFNNVTLQCEVDMGQCILINPPPYTCGSVNDGEMKANEFNCRMYDVCCNGTMISIECPLGYYFNSGINTCVEDDGFCVPTTTTSQTPPTETPCGDTPSGELAPVDSDCSAYQICCDGRYINFTCPDGMYFNSTIKVCKPDNGECRPPTINPPPYCDEGVDDGTIVSNPDNCEGYRVCCDGKYLYISCPAKYYFNEDTGVCEKNDGQCNPSPSTPFPPKEPCDVGVENGDVVSDPNNCEGYRICCDGQYLSVKCPPTYYFNKTSKVCEKNNDGQCQQSCDGGLQNGELTADSECSRYKLCCDSKLLVLYCQYGYYFDSKSKACKEDFSGNFCPLPTLAPPSDKSCSNYPNGTFIQNVGDCRGYFVCINGQIVEGSCDIGSYFDSNAGTCTKGDCKVTYALALPKLTTKVPKRKAAICSPELYGAYVSDENDCSSYYICYYSIPVRQTCPLGQYFDSENGVCSADQGQCKAETASPICFGRHGVMIRNPTDCRRFYICANGETIPYQCKENEFFNTATGLCEKDIGEKCKSPTKSVLGRNGRIEEAISCAGLGEGVILRNPVDCSAYYVCSNSFAMPLKCPAGYSFDGEQLYCRPDDGSCENSLAILPKSLQLRSDDLCKGNHGILVADTSDCSNFYVCVYGRVLSHEKCIEGEYFDKQKRQCAQNTGQCVQEYESPSKVCENKIEGAYLADPNDCTKFIMCTQSFAIPQRCPTGEFYDSVHHYCRTNDGSCSADSTEELREKNPCYKKHGVFVAEKECNKFSLCVNEQSVATRKCEPGLYYNEKSQKCIEDTKGLCEDYHSETHASFALPSCTGLSSKEFYSNSLDDCRTFFKCENNVAYMYTCPKGLIFNALLQHCDYPEFTKCVDASPKPVQNLTCLGKITGVRYVNADNGCQSFFVCVNGEMIEKSCKEGMLYNSELGVCDWPQNVQCESVYDILVANRNKRDIATPAHQVDNTICLGADENKFFGNARDNCLSFIKCVDNKAHMFTCPPGLMFNSENSNCDYPQSSVCYDQRGKRIQGPPCLDAPTGALVENVQTGCQSFFICDNKKGIEQFCQGGMLFNGEKNVCDWAQNVRCGAHSVRSKRSIEEVTLKFMPTCSEIEENIPYGIVEDNCQSFFKCVDNKAYVEVCPTGLVFNTLKGECDWSEQTLCLGPKDLPINREPCLSAAVGTFEENLKNGCRSYYVCDNTGALEQFCQEGMLFNVDKMACDWPQNVQCGAHLFRSKRSAVSEAKPAFTPSCWNIKEDHFYGIVEDGCRSFFKCVGYKAHVETCPEGLIFNALKGECDWSATTRCLGPNEVPVKPCEGLPVGALDENLENGCQSFFVCDNSGPLEQSCQEGMLFNIEKLACDWPENVRCGAKKHHHKRSIKKRSTNYTPSCWNVEQDKFYGVVEDDCRSFFKCVGYKAHVETCPEGLVFNALKGECDWPGLSRCLGPNDMPIKRQPCQGAPTGTLEENIKNGCQSFYLCDNNGPLEQFCQQGMLFNVEKRACDWSHNVRCGLRRSKRSTVANHKIQPPSCHNIPEDKFYGVAFDDCQSFFKCSEGNAVVIACPPGLKFNSVKQECDWPYNSQCFGPNDVDIKEMPCLGAPPGTYMENIENGCQSFFVCDNNVAVEQNCHDGMLFNIETKGCDWPDRVRCGATKINRQKRDAVVQNTFVSTNCAEVKQDKFYGVVEDKCRSFFKCIDNKAYVYKCPPGLIFNALKGECDWPHSTECFDAHGLAIRLQPCLGVKTGVLVENWQNDCKSFLMCENNKGIERFCPNGMLFNTQTQACDWPENVKCGAHFDSRKKREIVASLPSCFNVTENRFYGITSDNCQTFFQCTGNHAFVHTCPSGLVFNSIKNECDYPEVSKCEGPEKDRLKRPCLGLATGERIPNYDKQCHSFYVCDHNIAVEEFCKNDMRFNPKLKVCDWPENVQCVKIDENSSNDEAMAWYDQTVGKLLKKVLPLSLP